MKRGTRASGLLPSGRMMAGIAVVALLSLGCVSGGASVPLSGPPAGAEGFPGSSEPELRVTYTVVADSIRDDRQVESLVAPFRDRMAEEILQVIGEAAIPLAKATPEGTLGNFAADAMLRAARQQLDGPVHMALTNNGGLRVPIAPGPITVGQMYELMPFENMLSVLTLSGHQIVEMADQLAAVRGEPIAGFSFRIETEGDRLVARDLLIGGEPVELEAEYRLVTNDYMANGGDSPSAIHEPLARVDLPVLLRDAFIAYVMEEGVIRPELEGRIRGGIGR